MLLMACEMFGTSATKALPQAFAVELFHNFTLIHDDIMDEAPLRRGRPSVHKKFGASTAILSGDAMLVYAYEYLVKADAKVVSELLRVFNLCATRVCEGQQLDMNYEMSNKVTTKDYLIMIELKTAALLAASLQLGAIVGGASPKDSQHLYEFGGQLGVSFQLRDDLLDAFGESEKIGKQRGGDIVQNKKTFLFLEAMRIAEEIVGRFRGAADARNLGDAMRLDRKLETGLDDRGGNRIVAAAGAQRGNLALVIAVGEAETVLRKAGMLEFRLGDIGHDFTFRSGVSLS
jgi:geranylgeranyl pyrophosphate synthase